MEEEVENEEPVFEGTLSERLVHNNWKARSAAYIELAKVLDDSPSDAIEWEYAMKKVAGESLAPALEKAVEAIFAFLRAKEWEESSVAELIPVLIDKAFMGKPVTKKRAMEVLIEGCGSPSSKIILNSLVHVLKNKNPKIVATAVESISHCLKENGVKEIRDLNPIIKSIPQLFESRNATVRKEATNLCTILYSIKGDAFWKDVDTLRPAQKKEIEAALPTSAVAAAHIPQADDDDSKEVSATKAEDSTKPNALEESRREKSSWEAAEPVDMLKDLPENWREQLQSKKWLERKGMLEKLIEMGNVPRISSNGDYESIAREMKSILAEDSNVNVVAKAANVLAVLSRGLRKDFSSPSVCYCFSLLLEKLKERKILVLDSVRGALDELTLKTLNFDLVNEDIVKSLTNKSPAVRKEVLSLLSRTFPGIDTGDAQKVASALPQLAPPVVGACDDSSPDVREEAVRVLASLVSMYGNSRMAKYFRGKIDEKKMLRMQEFVDPSMKTDIQDDLLQEDDAIENSVPAPAKEKKVEKSRGKKVVKDRKVQKRGIPKINEDSAPAEKKGKAREVKKEKLPSLESVQDENEDLEPLISEEEAIEKATELLSSEIRAQLDESDWKVRLDALKTGIGSLVDGMSADDLKTNHEILTLYVCSTVGFKQSNPIMFSGVVNFMTLLITKTGAGFKRSVVKKFSRFVLEKIADTKAKSSVFECLTALVLNCGAQFTLQLIYRQCLGHKNPKVQTEGLGLVTTLLDVVKVSQINLKKLIAFAKNGVGNANAKVREAAVGLLAKMYSFYGDALKVFLKDLKPALLNTLEKEFEKVECVVSEEGGDDALQDIERKDVNPKFNSKLYKRMDDRNWKERMAGLEEVENIISAANDRITLPSADFMREMKKRLGDSNTNVIMKTAAIIEKLCRSVGKAFETFSKVIVPLALTRLTDKKKFVRDSILDLMCTWEKQMSLDSLVTCVPKALLNESPESRLSLLNFILERKEKIRTNVDIHQNFSKPLVSCMLDRNSQIRHAAVSLFEVIAISVTQPKIQRILSSLKPAEVQSLKPMIQDALSFSLDEESKGKVPVSRVTKRRSQSRAGVLTPRKITKKAVVDGDRRRSVSAPPRTPKKDIVAVEGLIPNKQKAMRHKKEQRSKWGFGRDLTDALLNMLKDQLIVCVTPALHQKMFSRDFKSHIAALNSLKICVEKQNEALESTLDCILKWCSVRLCDTNPAVLLKTVEFLDFTFQKLEKMEYRLSQYEASTFLPCLVEKVGSNNATLRENMKNLFKQLCPLLGPKLLFSSLYDGVETKNTRSRSTILEQMSELVELHGFDICSPPLQKVLPIISHYVGERDVGVREGALRFIVTVYTVSGHDKAFVEQNAGELPLKHQGLLEERLKKVKQNLGAPNDGQPVVTASPVTLSMKQVQSLSKNISLDSLNDPEIEAQFQLEIEKIEIKEEEYPSVQNEEIEKEIDSAEQSTPTKSGIDLGASQLTTPCLPSNEDLQGAANTERTASVVAVFEQIIDVMNDLEATLQTETSDAIELVEQLLHLLPQEECRDLPGSVLNNLISSLHAIFLGALNGLSNGLDAEKYGELSKGCLDVLMQVFQRRNFAAKVTEDSIVSIIQAILSALLNDKLTAERTLRDLHLSRAMNMTTLKLLTNSDRTRTLSALFTLLKMQNDGVSQQEKYKDLLYKCVLKFSKQLNVNALSSLVDTRSLLMKVNEFINERMNGGVVDNDKRTMRAIKSVLSELIELVGVEQLLEDINSLTEGENSTLKKYLECLSAAQRQKERLSIVPPTWEKQEYDVVTTPKSIQKRLSQIFQQINNKDDVHNGIVALHRFQKDHPIVDVEPFMSKCSAPFQQFIKAQLQRLSKKDKVLPGGRPQSAHGRGTPKRYELERQLSARSLRSQNEDSTSTDGFMKRLQLLQERAGMQTTMETEWPEDNSEESSPVECIPAENVVVRDDEVVDATVDDSEDIAELSGLSVDQIRERLKAATDVPPESSEPPCEQENETPTKTVNSPQSSLRALRERLAKLKQ